VGEQMKVRFSTRATSFGFERCRLAARELLRVERLEDLLLDRLRRELLLLSSSRRTTPRDPAW